MNSKDLRIGNLVEVFIEGETFIHEVLTIESDSSILECNGIIEYISLNKIKPIPLTEEWLKRFGFDFTDEFDFNLNGLSIDGGVCHFSFNMFRQMYDIDNCDFVEFPCIVLYVHQLQNLYHALTGEELKIK